MAIIKKLTDKYGREILPDVHEGLRPYKSDEKRLPQYKLQNDMVVEYKQVIVHTFVLGDVDDPDLYAAEPIYNWQQTDHGKWVMEHCEDVPVWNRYLEPMNYGHKYMIAATFDTKKLTEYYLRWGNDAAKRVPM